MKIFAIVGVIILALLGLYSYQQHKATLAANSGDTLSPDSSVTTSLATPDATPTPARRTSMPGTTSASTQAAFQADSNALPASDSIDRNPPNGTVFAGTGRIQVYRQGNITWRINTENGQACVLFATNREWRKPRVYNAGCNKS